MKLPLQFCFDFSSPYSYTASEWIGALAARPAGLVMCSDGA